MQRIAALGRRGSGERAAEDDVSGAKLLVVAGDLVCEPGDGRGGVVEHAGCEARFLDDGVLVEQGSDPAQVDTIRTDLSAAGYDSRIGGEVCDGVEHLAR